MKSIKYVAIAYLFVGAMNMQAMYSLYGSLESNSSSMAASAASASASEEEMIAAFNADMQKIEEELRTLDTRGDIPGELFYKVGPCVFSTPYRLSKPIMSSCGEMFRKEEPINLEFRKDPAYKAAIAQGSVEVKYPHEHAMNGRISPILWLHVVNAADIREGAAPSEMKDDLIERYKRQFGLDNDTTQAALRKLSAITFSCTRENTSSAALRKACFRYVDTIRDAMRRQLRNA